uniref:Lipocalin n=1 Tax=Rhipicephalus zambeziensis TaxID=60191 RepID=A0A224YKC2_9ACAR
MFYFAWNLIHSALLPAVVIFCSNCGAEYVKTNSKGHLNLLRVLNTSQPLYLFEWKPKIPTNETCVGYDCTKLSRTCEHMRKREMDRIYYNHTVSKLVSEKTWFNETLMGKFILGDPPHKVNVYNLTDPIPVPYLSSHCMELIYTQPHTYNCSVLLVSRDIYGMCNHSDPNVLATTKCSLYMRGKLAYSVYPPRECQFEFNKCSNSRIIYMPYHPSCAVDAQDEEGRKY